KSCITILQTICILQFPVKCVQFFVRDIKRDAPIFWADITLQMMNNRTSAFRVSQLVILDVDLMHMNDDLTRLRQVPTNEQTSWPSLIPEPYWSSLNLEGRRHNILLIFLR